MKLTNRNWNYLLSGHESGSQRVNILIVVALLVIFGSVVSLFFSLRDSPPKINKSLYQAISDVLAEETIRLLGGQGEIVLWTEATAAILPSDTIIKSFTKSLADQSQITVRGAEQLSVRDEPIESDHGTVPPSQLEELLRKYQGVDAVVSFVPAPFLTAVDIRRLPNPRPRVIIAFDADLADIPTLIRNDVVQLAIMPRMLAPTTETEPKTSRELFDRYFEVLTKENVANYEW